MAYTRREGLGVPGGGFLRNQSAIRRRDALLDGGIRNQVARELLALERVKRLVVAKRGERSRDRARPVARCRRGTRKRRRSGGSRASASPLLRVGRRCHQ